MQNIIIEKLLLSKDIEEYIKIEMEYSCSNQDEYKKALVKLGDERFSKFSRMLELSHLDDWQGLIVLNAFDFSFIQINEVKEAIDIMARYENEDIFFNECSISIKKLENKLANASQI